MDRNQCNILPQYRENMKQLPQEIQDRIYKDFLFEPFFKYFAFKGTFFKLKKVQNIGGRMVIKKT